MSCAWRLSRKGTAVTVFDAGEAAREASWAGAGMLAPGGEFEQASPLSEAALLSLAEYPEFVGELESETGIAIDFRRCGAVEVAFTDAEAEALHRKGGRQATMGIHSEQCVQDGREARCYPGDSVVDPRDVTRALLAACRSRGVEIYEHEPVLAVAESGESVRTVKQTYSAEGVIIAAGAWSSALMPGLPRSIPVRGHLISWSLAPGALGPILRHGHTYLLQRANGTLIGGATSERVGFERAIDQTAVADLQFRAGELWPALKSLAPSDSWNGFRPGIEAEGPAVGRIGGSRVWAAFGHYRNGILLAPDTSRRIVESVVEGFR